MATLLQRLLWPASAAFEGATRLRAAAFRWGVRGSRRLSGTVISVGNLTVGGTGKTPMVMWLVERLLAEGKRVGILTRGYRGDAEGGRLSDEVALVKGRLGGRAQFGIGADRYAKGRMLERHGVEWFVLDDGFQHLQLARDVDIVLIDASDPFGGGHLLPAGRLREPKSALARADVVVITRSEHAPAIEAVVRRFSAAPIFYAQTRFEGVFRAGAAGAVPLADRQGTRFFAFCGIGNPGAFFDDLKRWGFDVVGQARFHDHYRYSASDAAAILHGAESAGATGLICTEKDTYNLDPAAFARLPLFFCRISLLPQTPAELWSTILATAERKRSEIAR